MADRSSKVSALERAAAIAAADEHARISANRGGGGTEALVDAVIRALGMTLPPPEYRSLADAPRDGTNIYLRTRKRGEVIATWWKSWEDPAVDHPWAWREVFKNGMVGPPIEEADGWRPA